MSWVSVTQPNGFLLCFVSVFMVVYLGNCVNGIPVVDLTHVQDSNTIFWPGNPQFNFTILYRGLTDGGYWYESNAIQTPEHGGTHVDAPSHFAKDKLRIDQIPMSKLCGPGVIINVKEKARANPDYRVQVSDLKVWEDKYGRIPDGAVVLMNSGWSDKYPNKTLTFGTESVNDPSTFHFPGWHEDAADWLVKNRNVNVVGVDTPSNDYGQSTTFDAHVILATANINGLENVANLDNIPEAGSTIYVAVINLQDGSGGPARVFATNLDNSVNAASFSTSFKWVLALCILLTLG
ncbi:hypothetical protein ACF0H5_018430 [Mactra antiquata]